MVILGLKHSHNEDIDIMPYPLYIERVIHQIINIIFSVPDYSHLELSTESFPSINFSLG